jgi:hypothetical protein
VTAVVAVEAWLECVQLHKAWKKSAKATTNVLLPWNSAPFGEEHHGGLYCRHVAPTIGERGEYYTADPNVLTDWWLCQTNRICRDGVVGQDEQSSTFDG